MKIEMNYSCCLCEQNCKQEIELPEGWVLDRDMVDIEKAFCPEHSPIAEWTDSQCSGCVGSWGDCRLWQSFAYLGERNLTEEDFKKIRSGICPKRTNGTFEVQGRNLVGTINLSNKATSGVILAKAIKDYWERYP
jgi:hypothetical protein